MNYTPYQQLRQIGCPPKVALWQIKAASPARLQWHDGKAAWHQDGFLLTAQLTPETGPDLDYLGWFFSNHWEPGARRKDRYSPWVVPAHSVHALYRELRRLKFGRAQAWDIANRQHLENYRRFLSYGDEWYLGILDVTAVKCGVVLGRATLCSVESDVGAAHLSSLAWELAGEAIEEARRKLAQLCRAAAASCQ